MSETKEKILLAALRLFAEDGYEAVPVSRIAGELGITKGALYKHYKNKRDIFDSIVERMYALDAERAEKYSVPQESYEESASSYCNVALESLKEFTAAQLEFWTNDDFARNFRRMLTLEQYRNEEMSKLYHSCLTAGPTEYTENIFKEMMARGALAGGDAKCLAVEFYAPLFLLVNVSDSAENRFPCREILNSHIERFIDLNSTAANG